MSIQSLKERLRDVPGIETLTMRLIGGRQTFGFDGLLVATDLSAAESQIETAIRDAVQNRLAPAPVTQSSDLIPPVTLQGASSQPLPAPTKADSMSVAGTGGFASNLRAQIEAAKGRMAQGQTDASAKVAAGIAKLDAAMATSTQVATSVAKSFEDEADALLSEIGQFSNMPPE
jgi:hypothetical protein